MSTRPLAIQQPSRLRVGSSDGHRGASVLKPGAVVSVGQSALFVVIGVASLALGVDRLVDNGFANLALAAPAAFRLLCVAFLLIAVLGLAITPAEQMLIELMNGGLARFGAVLAYLGQAGTIAFFAWWLVGSYQSVGARTGLDIIAPTEGGVMFELMFVGAWVWIIAGLMLAILAATRDPHPRAVIAANTPARVGGFLLTPPRRALLVLARHLEPIDAPRISVDHFYCYEQLIDDPAWVARIRCDPLIADARRLSVRPLHDLLHTWNGSQAARQLHRLLLVIQGRNAWRPRRCLPTCWTDGCRTPSGGADEAARRNPDARTRGGCHVRPEGSLLRLRWCALCGRPVLAR